MITPFSDSSKNRKAIDVLEKEKLELTKNEHKLREEINRLKKEVHLAALRNSSMREDHEKELQKVNNDLQKSIENIKQMEDEKEKQILEEEIGIEEIEASQEQKDAPDNNKVNTPTLSCDMENYQPERREPEDTQYSSNSEEQETISALWYSFL